MFIWYRCLVFVVVGITFQSDVDFKENKMHNSPKNDELFYHMHDNFILRFYFKKKPSETSFILFYSANTYKPHMKFSNACEIQQ